MKVVITKDRLLKCLNTVSRAVPVRSTMDVLKCVLIEAEDNMLTLTANDTSLGIETKAEAMIDYPGSVAVDAALFSSIIRKLPENDVTIETDEMNNLSIRCENSKFTIGGRGTEDFIYLPDVAVTGEIVLSQFTLREMIGQVIFSISDSQVNAAMAGVYMEVLGDKIRMTTLDLHRISIRTNELKEFYGHFSAIVPGKTLSDLSKIISGEHDKEIRIAFAKNHILFRYENTKLVSRVIEGEYFKVESMLKQDYKTHFKINKRDFLNCLDRSTPLINESDNKPVIFQISENNLGIVLKSAIGFMDEHLEIEKDGEDMKIAFNPKLLMDALRVIDDEIIDVYMVRFNYPCTIKDEGESYIYEILPVNYTED